MIFNLTTHICNNKSVETEPRLTVSYNIRDGNTFIDAIKNAIKDIPRNSDVLIGGHPGYILIFSQLSRILGYRIWLWDSNTQSPYKATFLNRMDRYEIERFVQ